MVKINLNKIGREIAIKHKTCNVRIRTLDSSYWSICPKCSNVWDNIHITEDKNLIIEEQPKV